MTYSEVIDYLYAQLPTYQTQGASALNFKLDKITKICELLGNPQNKLKCIHIAGTNGKGSTSHFVSSMLQENGYRVGLYTSPHLTSFTERIRINQHEIPEKDVVHFVTNYKEIIEEFKPSFFEWTVALAFHYFAHQLVDFAVIEVGMGGRLDSTNIITPQVSVVTNIGLDHEEFLGNSIYAIAKEKLGIVKPGVPLIIGEQQRDTLTAIKEAVTKNHCKVKWASEATDYLKGMNLNLPDYLKRNAQTACHILLELENQGAEITYGSFLDGIESVVSNTGLKGRWQQLSKKPLMYCDTGHNEDGIKEVIKCIKGLDFENLHIVFGVVQEKSIDKIICLLPKQAKYYWCASSNPRSMPAIDLAKRGSEHGLNGIVCMSVKEAIDSAKLNAREDDLIFIGGSNFVIAEIEGL